MKANLKADARRYRSERLAVLHKTAAGLHRIGLINKATMREFDAAALTHVEKLSPADIKSVREREEVSQAVFAQFLNVKAKLVSEWERGEKRPAGPALKLLSLVKAKGLAAIA